MKGDCNPTRHDHDDCLDVCWHFRAKITGEEFHLLNIVAGNWAAQLPVTIDQLRGARVIVARVRGAGA